MWTNYFLEYSVHKNFNYGFTSHKNDIHLYLSQWQYWWWFWFSIFWTAYFFIILRIVILKTYNYETSVNTSLRSHGKWGDFLVALIPLSWCGNILVNSNFILRMIEWQNESSLFTLRIQGKQWYWSYKYSSDTNYKIHNVYLNVGNNNWFKPNQSNHRGFFLKNSTLTYLFEREFLNKYKITTHRKAMCRHFFLKNKHTLSAGFKNIYLTLKNINNKVFSENTIHVNLKKNLTINNIKLQNSSLCGNNYKNYSTASDYFYSRKTKNTYNMYDSSIYWSNKNKLFTQFSKLNLKFEADNLTNTEDATSNMRILKKNSPIRLMKGVLTKSNLNLLLNNSKLEKNIFLNFKIYNKDITKKIAHIEQNWGFFQKKYKKLDYVITLKQRKFDNQTFKLIDKFVYPKKTDYKKIYNNFETNNNQNELIPATLARRLLRTKRTLVLPAHVNITLITNSYDVVHSWFVPGLGLKIDCVPGRSTHHSLYVDNIGFYYGQCAEICGRYHHHMPIRVCAINFEHFLLWWHHKGMRRTHRINLDKTGEKQKDWESAYEQKKKKILLQKFN